VSSRIDPNLVVLNAVSRERVRPVLRKLRALARRHWVALGGSAAEDDTLERSGILALAGDPTAEAARVTTLILSATTPRSRA
jgi:MerR family transcriptional regulator, light-induced transcriptional regulator